MMYRHILLLYCLHYVTALFTYRLSGSSSFYLTKLRRVNHVMIYHTPCEVKTTFKAMTSSSLIDFSRAS